MTKYCPNCGNPYEEGIAFCAGCGTPLAGGTPARVGFKSAITKQGLSQIAGKSVKVFTIIALVLALIFTVQNVFGNFEIAVDQYYNGKISETKVFEARDLYPGVGQSGSSWTTGVMVGNILYAIGSAAVAVLAAWVLLEKACGGDYKKIFKLMGVVALAATAVYILVYLIFAAQSQDSYRIAVQAPVSAWVTLVFYFLTAVVGALQPKD